MGKIQKIITELDWSIKALLILIVLIFIGYFGYARYQRSVFCNQFMNIYVKNPPINIHDYTNRDIIFDELCSPINKIVDYVPWIIGLVILSYVLRKNKTK